MKNLLFLLLLFPFCLQAQLSKGDAIIGGDVNAVRQPNGIFRGSNPMTISIAPAYSCFLSDHILVGGALSTYTSLNGDNSFFSLSLQPYTRYYFKPKQKNNFLYGELGGTVRSLFSSSQELSTGLRLGLGLDHFVAPGVSVNFSANVVHDFSLSRTNLVIQAGMNAFLQSAASEGSPIATQVLQAGNLIIGGSSFHFNRGIDDTYWSLNFSPGVGYFITNHWVAGADVTLSTYAFPLNISPSPSVPSQEEIFISNDFLINVYMRYYGSERARLAPYLATGFTYQKSSSGIRGSFSYNTGAFLDLSVGVDYFLTRNLALEGNLTFNKGFGYRSDVLYLNGSVQFFFLR